MSKTDGPDSLPKGWAQVKLAALGALHCGQSPSVAEVNSKGIGTPYVTGPEQWDGQSIRMHKWTTAPKRVVPDGTIFITVKGAGVGTLFPGCACAIGRDIYAFEPSDSIDRDFLVYGLRYNINEIIRKAQGDIPGLTKEHILDHEIPLPPMSEQRRIVTKLETLLAKVDASRKRLERIPVILKRFRQAVLAAACDGRLTEDWCLVHPQMDRVETTLGTIAIEFRTGPFGSALHQSDYVSGGVPVINPTNIVDGAIVPNLEVSVSSETHKRLADYSLRVGDIIIARRGEMGRCAVVGREEAGWLCGTGSALIRIGGNAIPEYIQALISSPDTRRFLTEGAVGSTMANLNQGVFRSVPVILPSIEEQAEILRRINELNRVADQIEARYAKAKAQVDRLTQSILAKAFRGELVPQAPNDEPAEVLLSRLAGAPAEASAQVRRRGRSPRAQPATPAVAPAPPAEDHPAPGLADLTPEAIHQAHREVLASIRSPLAEDDLLRAVSLRLGFRRLGARIKSRLLEVLAPIHANVGS